jgi:hypothetical protein
MATRKMIRNASGYIVATIDDFNGEDVIRDRHSNIIGRYDRKTDCTRDQYGNLVGYGDLSANLIK